jgi:hypothetical protein
MLVMKIVHLVSALSLVAPAAALADPSIDSQSDAMPFDHYVAPPSNALEIAVGTGYSQGAGPIAGGMANHLEDLTGPGGAVELDLGYRINPMLSIGGFGTLAKYATGTVADDGQDNYSATAGIQAIAHIRPDRSVDPWLSLGTGWKGLWISPEEGKTTSLQGLELARLQLGIDYRITRDVAIAPVIGGSLDMFLQESSPMTSGYTDLQTKKANFTGFAGVAGRFDVAGGR